MLFSGWEYMDLWYCFFFFFQAEDGIRDGRVTGVQTCALPILRDRMRTGRKPPRDVVLAFVADEEAGGRLGARHLVENHAELFDGCTEAISERSEERRVGKECRSRWSPDHEKKKSIQEQISTRI